MKTPKRTPWQWTNEHCLKDNGELRATINEQCSRWKRKNKVKQLKHTIARQKAKICALEFKCEDHQHNMLIVQHTLKRQLESMNKAYFSHANVLNNLIDLKKL